MKRRNIEVAHRDRRDLLKSAASVLLVSPVLSLFGCMGRSSEDERDAGSAQGRWASGGTEKIRQTERFPQPFAADLSGACVLTCMTTIGPCHTASPERRDVSDGLDGLPLRLALRVVDAGCKPVQGAIVEIWHTNRTGGYSGDVQRMCINDQDDTRKWFFRGYQRTNEQGCVDFDTCYPGWYRGRAVHIHLRVMVDSYVEDDRASSAVTTQLLFPDVLNREIFTTHPLYASYGEPDTTLDSDGVVGAEKDKSPYLFDVVPMENGVMFASKTLVVRQSMDAPVCEAQGIAPPGGFGPPPDGRGPPPGGPGGFGPPPRRPHD